MPLDKDIEQILKLAIEEDFRGGDVTTLACVPETAKAVGKLLIKQAGVVAGLPFLRAIFELIDPKIDVAFAVEEGSYHKAGAIIGLLNGPARGILTAQTVALNLVKHLSGIATLTAAYVRKVQGLSCDIMDTRKTMPGLRMLEKYAVRVGGGKNHRFGLDDRFVIKASHLFFLAGNNSSPIKEAVLKVKAYNPDLPIEVEIERVDQLQEALSADIEAVLLYQMTPEEVKMCVKMARKSNKKIYVESSKAITLDTVRAYAETGVDGICIPALTDSPPSVDIKLSITRPSEEQFKAIQRSTPNFAFGLRESSRG